MKASVVARTITIKNEPIDITALDPYDKDKAKIYVDLTFSSEEYAQQFIEKINSGKNRLTWFDQFVLEFETPQRPIILSSDLTGTFLVKSITYLT